MTQQIREQQLQSYKGGFASVSGVAVSAAASSVVVTSALTALLSTVTKGGGSLPLQAASLSAPYAEGVVTTAGVNVVPLLVNGQKVTDASGNAVFGQISVSGGIWTVNFFSDVAGTVTAYTFAAATTVSLQIPLFFTLADYPYTSDFAYPSADFAADVGGGIQTRQELVSVTATNTLANLTKTPASYLKLYVNGIAYSSKDNNAAFTFTGKAITWNAANAFPLLTTDNVVAEYVS